jgi:hypothetical protein
MQAAMGMKESAERDGGAHCSNQLSVLTQHQQAQQLWVYQGVFIAYGQRVFNGVVRNTIADMTVTGVGSDALSNSSLSNSRVSSVKA